MVKKCVKATRDQRMLLDDLADVRALAKLERLGQAIWELRRGPQQGLALVRAVAKREDVLAPRGVEQLVVAVVPGEFGLEGTHLPVQRRGRPRALVGGPGRDQPHVLQERGDGRQKLPAAQLDPTSLGIGDQYDGPMQLGKTQCLSHDGCQLSQTLALRCIDDSAIIQAQSLALHPGAGENGVVPVEDEQSFLFRETDPFRISGLVRGR
mmetsp:Transcript_48767/g.127241  ORF Transcript_48767/g.127241 Transcript_48767/m.127241 type:complete len:209 (+) Transcript_48767:136-762(+)